MVESTALALRCMRDMLETIAVKRKDRLDELAGAGRHSRTTLATAMTRSLHERHEPKPN